MYFINNELKVQKSPTPQIQQDQILIKTQYAGINRPDLAQQQGKYKAPKEASQILGLEVAGEVVAVANNNQNIDSKRNIYIGDAVFGLTNGGAYAEYCILEKDLAIKIPEGISPQKAASMPENWLTAILNLVFIAGLNETCKNKILIHAGASGVGMAAIQLAKHLKQKAYATVGNNQKVTLCTQLGATTFNYNTQDFQQEIKKHLQETNNHPKLDIILDCVGAPYFQKNIALLKDGGKLINIGVLGGSQVELNLALMLVKRLQLIGSTLRPQSLEIKTLLTEYFISEILPKASSLHVPIDSIYHYSEVKKAFEKMEQNQNLGKMLLRFD